VVVLVSFNLKAYLVCCSWQVSIWSVYCDHGLC